MPALPVDVWFMIFDHVSDNDTLWSVARNVSRYLRACVDEFFSRSLLRDCIVDLIYSTIHSHGVPPFSCLFVPMQFTRLSENGTRAVFCQVQYKDDAPKAVHGMRGSVRGWVPFIERYCMETRKPAPRVANKSTHAPVLWEQEYKKCSDTLSAMELRSLRDQLSIGRGDRPPYVIRLPPYVHDTELADLAIDCLAREISFDWRRTLSAFFLERHFMVLASQNASERRVYDKALISATVNVRAIALHGNYYTKDRHLEDWRRARRKRLQPWVTENKKRMSNEHRLMTEDSVVQMARGFHTDVCFREDNLVEIHDEDVDVNEAVPERCANDHPDLMLWPNGRRARKKAENEVKISRPGCIVM
jgi:hypothetical protein